MITPNILNCIKAVRLFDKGAFKKGYALIKDCTGAELLAAAEILERQARYGSMVQEIGERHQAKEGDTVGAILSRAAAAGDERAKTLIDCGFLDQRIY
jgi:hypothetical protein